VGNGLLAPAQKAGLFQNIIHPMDELRQMAERLRQVQHFKHFSATDLTAIVSLGQVRHFRIGETIFQEGEPCSGMYVLLRGQVHLRKMGPQGQTNIVSIIEPVIMFNEVAVLDGGANPLSAEAVEDCRAWQISYDSFQILLQRKSNVTGIPLARWLPGSLVFGRRSVVVCMFLSLKVLFNTTGRRFVFSILSLSPK
jgi:hypothetical protein